MWIFGILETISQKMKLEMEAGYPLTMHGKMYFLFLSIDRSHWKRLVNKYICILYNYFELIYEIGENVKTLSIHVCEFWWFEKLS